MGVCMMNDLKASEKRYRLEIEGIRAIAAILVAVYHIWLGTVSGGVDVFFIVSGYLITTSLLSKVEKKGRINLFEYLLGLAKRLFPIAFTVLLSTTILSIVIMPQVKWLQVISEIFPSSFYFQNWQLANNAVDYLAQNNEASPFQHYWALSIQGQFYITWPIIILLSYFIAKKVLKKPIRVTLLTLLSVIFISSISYSVYITATNQPWAYFDTFARVWEFSLGGILALLIPYLKFNKSICIFIGWMGLAVICLTGILLPVSNVFPGYAALLPTTGVILVIIASENSSRFGVEKLLGSKPFLFFGSISYGFYLWHWPLLIFYMVYLDTDSVSIQGGLAILLTTFILAFLSVKILETPVRKMNIKQSKVKLIAILATFILPVVFIQSSWESYVVHTQSSLNIELEMEDYPGARAIINNIVPNPDKKPLINVKSHLPVFYDFPDCYSNYNDPKVKLCSYGEIHNPDYTIALVGGSHSGHWFPALEEIANELKLKIDVYNKDACRFSDDNFDGTLVESCMEWNETLINLLVSNPPNLVFTTANVNKGDTIPIGYINQWKKLEGITKVFAVRDNPRMLVDPPFCVEKRELELCTVLRKDALSEKTPWENTEGIPGNVTFADLSEYFCDDLTCFPVIGNVLVYRDTHHISTLYSKSLAPVLQEYIVATLDSLNQ
jgi:peptidoglycan/LPS O-acetylase OafA/YrhL